MTIQATPRREFVTVQIEGFSGQKVGAVDRLVPGAPKASRLAVAQARGILRDKALLGKGVQSGKERQTLIGDLVLLCYKI
jgi:hypothetical protein